MSPLVDMGCDTVSDAQRTEIESFITEWMSDDRIPGAAVAVTNADDIRYAEGFGARNLERNEPATEESLIGVGSCTKSFTAAAIMHLVEASALSVDDPVDEYIPHLENVPGDPVTIRELLTHTSGMPDDGSIGPLITRPLGLGHIEVPLSSKDDFRRHVEGSVDRRVTERETFFYYGSGYVVLGEIIEAVSGQSFATYVTENILDPLGMERSTFSREAFETADDRMTHYTKQDGNATPTDFPFDPLIQPPGGLVSSATEMAEYVRMYMNDGSLDGESILTAESVAEMRTPASTFGSYLDGTEIEYGYGLMMEEFLDDRLIGHAGSVSVSTAWFGYLEDAELGVAIHCTSTPESQPMVVGPAVLSILRDEDPIETVPYFRLVDALDTVVGSYETYRGIGSATVERDSGMLTLTQGSKAGGQELHLIPETLEEDLLVCSTVLSFGTKVPVRFELDDDVRCYLDRSLYTKK